MTWDVSVYMTLIFRIYEMNMSDYKTIHPEVQPRYLPFLLCVFLERMKLSVSSQNSVLELLCWNA